MKKILYMIMSLMLLVVLLGCQKPQKQNLLSLENENSEKELPCYKIKTSNVSSIKVKIHNDNMEEGSIPLTGVVYAENREDQGKIIFEEFKNEKIKEGDLKTSIIARYNTDEIDDHFQLSITEADIDFKDYEVLNLYNNININENDTIRLFSIKCNSQIYDISLEVYFHEN